jgi:predicted transcriptional regulator
VVRPSDVAAAIGISRQLAGYHLKHLAASGKVDRDRGTYRLRGHHVDRADRGSGNVTRQSSD